MSLLNSMGSNASPTIRLLMLQSLPTTEDLKYMITTANKAAKPVQLPFKREQGAPTFILTFTRPNRWSFEKGDGIGANTIWTKESADVMVIQNKVKNDSAVFSNASEDRPDSQSCDSGSHLATPSGRDSLNRIFPVQPNSSGGFSGSASNSNLPAVPPGPPPSFMSFGDWTPGTADAVSSDTGSSLPLEPTLTPIWDAAVPTDDAESNSISDFAQTSPPENWQADETAVAVSQPREFLSQATEPYSATNQTIPVVSEVTSSTSNQMESDEQEQALVELPEPLELDPSVIDIVSNSLRDLSTGLTSFPAFTFFLMRELIRSEVSGANLSVVVFDFADLKAHKMFSLSVREMQALVTHLDQFCSRLHIASRLDSGEFVVLLCDCAAEQATAFVNVLRQHFEEDDFLLRLCTGPTALCMGIAAAPETSRDPGTLLAAALQAKDAARKNATSYQIFGCGE